MAGYLSRDLLQEATADDLRLTARRLANNARAQRQQAEQMAVPEPEPVAPPEAPAVDFGALTKSLTSYWTDEPAQQPQQQPASGGSGFDLGGLVRALTATWRDPEPAPTPSGTPSAMPGQNRPLVEATIQDGRVTPPTSGGDWRSMPVRAPMNADTPPATGDIDNSSRASFVRTAWPYMLQAAGGDQNLAELMIAKAISENGSIGTGRPFWANNFSGIKGEGDAGSVEADTWEDYGNGPVNIRDRFAAYSTPQAGMAAFMDFLRNNSRYHGALARYQETGNADALFDDILAAGYATDKQWANKVRAIRDSQVAPIVRGQTADPRQSSMNAVGAASSSPLATGPAAGPPAGSGAGSLPPQVAQKWRQQFGRDATPDEVAELMGVLM